MVGDRVCVLLFLRVVDSKGEDYIVYDWLFIGVH